jgi:hypothetical protein
MDPDFHWALRMIRTSSYGYVDGMIKDSAVFLGVTVFFVVLSMIIKRIFRKSLATDIPINNGHPIKRILRKYGFPVSIAPPTIALFLLAISRLSMLEVYGATKLGLPFAFYRFGSIGPSIWNLGGDGLVMNHADSDFIPMGLVLDVALYLGISITAVRFFHSSDFIPWGLGLDLVVYFVFSVVAARHYFRRHRKLRIRDSG